MYYDKAEEITQAILDGVIAEFAAQSITLPSRRLLGYAGMPLDCEMLAVYLNRMYQVNQASGPESEAQAVHRCVYWAGSEVDVILLRCTPQPRVVGTQIAEVPKTAVETFSRLVMKDPFVMARGVKETWAIDALGLGANLTFLETAPIGDESGGLRGLRLRVRVGNLL